MRIDREPKKDPRARRHVQAQRNMSSDRLTEKLEVAAGLMTQFAERTGVVGDAAPKRYLWTDAFAVCNFLELADLTGESRWTELAETLVDEVHHTLGRHRDDDARVGWISGLSEADGEKHPTAGGLRIGKPEPERPAGAPLDQRREWDRDGQYFHYLTRWMQALDAMYSAHRVDDTQRAARYLHWARDLAHAAHDGFVIDRVAERAHPAMPSAGKRMVWKMSIDLSRPLVPSMGHHDPLDGWITFEQLARHEHRRAVDRDTVTTDSASTGRSAVDLTEIFEKTDLSAAIDDMRAMCQGRDWTTHDPLGLGGLLVDACRVAQMLAMDAFDEPELLETLLQAAHVGIASFLHSASHRARADQRLAFRELGLSIGLRGLPFIRASLEELPAATADPAIAWLDELETVEPLARNLESFWSQPEHRQLSNWTGHQDINDVMLATAMIPEGYLLLGRH